VQMQEPTNNCYSRRDDGAFRSAWLAGKARREHDREQQAPGSRRRLASPFALPRPELLPTSQISSTTTQRHLKHTYPPIQSPRPRPHQLRLSHGLQSHHILSPDTLRRPSCLLYVRPRPSLPANTPCRCSPQRRRQFHPAHVLTVLQMLKTRKKKNVKKGIQFCLMVCGASGTGTWPWHAGPTKELTIHLRTDDLRKHPLRQEGPAAQGI
jgi:hypothetical protein